MSVRAKFRVYSVTDYGNQKQVTLSAVADNGGSNKSWAKYTPSGELKMTIDNPEASDQFAPGQHFFLDFTPTEP
jgi:hypothetical protein